MHQPSPTDRISQSPQACAVGREGVALIRDAAYDPTLSNEAERSRLEKKLSAILGPASLKGVGDR